MKGHAPLRITYHGAAIDADAGRVTLALQWPNDKAPMHYTYHTVSVLHAIALLQHDCAASNTVIANPDDLPTQDGA